MEPRIEDGHVDMEGCTIRTRRAFYPNGRVETWIEAPIVEDTGRRLDDSGVIVHDGDGMPLPIAVEASVLLRNGLWDGVDVTANVLATSLDQLLLVRDGDVDTLPFKIPRNDDFEIVSSICRYFGVLPGFDSRGMHVPHDLDEARLESARSFWERARSTSFGP